MNNTLKSPVRNTSLTSKCSQCRSRTVARESSPWYSALLVKMASLRWASLRWLHLPGSFGFNMSNAKHLFLGSLVYVQMGWESKYQVSPGSIGMEKQLEVIWVVALLDYAIYRQGECWAKSPNVSDHKWTQYFLSSGAIFRQSHILYPELFVKPSYTFKHVFFLVEMAVQYNLQQFNTHSSGVPD